MSNKSKAIEAATDARHSTPAPGSAPAYSAYEKDGGVFLRVPHHDEWGNTHSVHGLTIYAARDLIRELKAAADLADSKIERRHRYEPNKKYPWFCRHCGYAEHEEIMHLPNRPVK